MRLRSQRAGFVLLVIATEFLMLRKLCDGRASPGPQDDPSPCAPKGIYWLTQPNVPESFSLGVVGPGADTAQSPVSFPCLWARSQASSFFPCWLSPLRDGMARGWCSVHCPLSWLIPWVTPQLELPLGFPDLCLPGPSFAHTASPCASNGLLKRFRAAAALRLSGPKICCGATISGSPAPEYGAATSRPWGPGPGPGLLGWSPRVPPATFPWPPP